MTNIALLSPSLEPLQWAGCELFRFASIQYAARRFVHAECRSLLGVFQAYENTVIQTDSSHLAAHDCRKTQPRFLIIGRFLYQRKQLSLIYWSSGHFKNLFHFIICQPAYQKGTARLYPKEKKKKCFNAAYTLISYYNFFCIQITKSIRGKNQNRAAELVSDRWRNRSERQSLLPLPYGPSNKNSLGSSDWLHRHPHPLCESHELQKSMKVQWCWYISICIFSPAVRSTRS